MIKKILYFVTILLSLFNVNSSKQYSSKSYINNNSDIYTIQNYCIENDTIDDYCYTITKTQLYNNDFLKQKRYKTLNKDVIKNDFNNINLNNLLSNNN